MNKILNESDVKFVELKIKEFESLTGCELLVILNRESDQYPGAIWRFGVISSFVTTFLFSLFFDFHHSYYWPVLMMILVILFLWVGHFGPVKKFSLIDSEVERECREKAFEYFHSLGTSKVSHKVTAMIMLSLLEKKIMVLVDEKLKQKISQENLDELILLMKMHFKKGQLAMGLVESIKTLQEKILKNFDGKVSDVNASELKDEIIFL